MDIVERVFLSLIVKYKPRDIEYALDKNLDLATAVQIYAPHLIQVGRGLSKVFRPNTEDLNVTNMMSYIQQKRPDLFSIIVRHKNGTKWLKANIRAFKKLLWLK